MGVHGLWQLIEPSGRPVPLETLERKVLAVDVSIWLHQVVKGFQDAKGAPVPNAHLLGIYHRVCKLLYFKIKPIFVFDGGVPALKRQTIAKRNQQNSRNVSEAERLQKQLLSTLLKHSAVSRLLSEKTKASLTVPPKKTTKRESIYFLPPTELDTTVSSSEEDDSEDTDSSPTKHWDLHTIDMSSNHFKSLPVDVRHEILTDLKETRKQNSWGRLHEMPKKSDDFSGYQVKRLLKRQAVQSALEEAEKEMGGHSLSLAELESILKDCGVAITNDMGKRIASDENTRFLYIKDVKEAREKAQKEQERLETLKKEGTKAENVTEVQLKNKGDQEFEEDLQMAIALSLEEEPSTSKKIGDTKKLEFSFLENFNDEDFLSDSSEESEDASEKKTFSSAQNYMIEYSGLTPSEIAKIMEDKNKKSLKKGREKKRTEKRIEVKTIEVSDSEDSNEFVEVPVRENEAEGIKDIECTEMNIKEISDEREKLRSDVDVVKQIICDNGELLSKENKVEEVKNEEIPSREASNNNKSVNNVTVFQDEVIKLNNNPDKAEIEKPKLVTEKLKGDNNENNDGELDSIEIMSDSGESSSSVEFLEVSESKEIKTSMQIVIDVNEGLDKKSNLFGDIASKTEDDKERRRLEIVIDPQTKLEDDLFSDIFENITEVTDTEVKCDTDSKKVEVTTKEDSSVPKVKIPVATEERQVEVHKNDTIAELVIEPEIKIAELKGDTEKCIKPREDAKKNENTEIKKQVEEIERLKLSVEEMQDLKHDLQREKIDLMVQRSTRERMATNITDQMYQEAQELLELFGVPYIVAPMEAEAQCAFLDAVELTEGTITDDSDIWLFGGRTVYKNFFNQSKYVMEFKVENIKHHFKLTREQMILLAMLVGSDYTTGVPGIGPVTALEVLAAFPPSQTKEFTLSHAELISGLKEFQSWIKKGRNAGPGRSTLKNKLKNVILADNFPNLQVVQAYMDPTVDSSQEKFSWGKPDFEGLTDFARSRFGWSARKTEEILKPVINRMEEKRVQTSIKDFFKTKHKIISSQEAKQKMSKRVKSAVERIGKTPEELIAEEMEALSKAQQKKTRGKQQTGNGGKTARKKKSSVKSENSKEISEEVIAESKPKQRRVRKKPSEDSANKIAEDAPVSSPKKPRRKGSLPKAKLTSDEGEIVAGTSLGEDQSINEEDELQKYENIAKELKKRRQRRNELSKQVESGKKKQTRAQLIKKPVQTALEALKDEEKEASFQPMTNEDQLQRIIEEVDESKTREITGNDLEQQQPENSTPKRPTPTVDKNFMETIPEGLEEDEEIQFFQATTSRSLKRVEEINQDVKRELDQEAKKKRLPNFHKKEVIHQKLRHKDDVLRNKLKAIEVFRKSRKGPGYVGRRKRNVKLPKEEAGLSEDSDE